MIWFQSDTHYNHQNILKYCQRPFASVEEMNEALIKNWNDRVGKLDTVYFLGDFCFARGNTHDQANIARNFKRRLNGVIHFIKGNHDKPAALIYQEWASWHHHGLEVQIDGILVTLSHYCHLVWNASHRGSFHLHGHSHNTLKEDPNALRFDVGVDANNFAPVSWDEVKKRMAKKTFKPIDAHGR